MSDVVIIPYEPRYQPDFKRLNVDWISRDFTLEDHDLEQLDHPETHILPNNGAIFLAKLGDEIVGTVALVNTGTPDRGETGFELAKMSVSPKAQGRGIGQLLCVATLDYARQLGLKSIWLESNRRAKTALRLYERVGFREVPMAPSPYARADIRMEIDL